MPYSKERMPREPQNKTTTDKIAILSLHKKEHYRYLSAKDRVFAVGDCMNSIGGGIGTYANRIPTLP